MQPRPSSEPRAPGTPCRDAVDAEDGADQQRVEDRVAEVDGGGGGARRRILGGGFQQQGRARGEHDQHHRDAVEPAVQTEVRDLLADEQGDPRRGEWVPGQPQRVRRRRVGRRGVVRVEDRPEDIAGRPGRQPEAERVRDRAPLRVVESAREAQHGGAAEHRVVNDDVEERVVAVGT